jgi:hypothetical protein
MLIIRRFEIKNYIIIWLYSYVAITLSFAAFQDTGWGTRAGGMGNSFTAIANDASASLWNPAGISQLEMFETTFMYNKLFMGVEDVNLSQMYFAGVYPSKIGAFGLTITDFSLFGYYRENMASLSYSCDIGSKFPINMGLNLKYLMHSYILDDRTENMDDPVFSKKSAGGFTPDFGFLLKPGRFSFGISALNILQPDIGLKTEDKVPMIIKFGTAYRLGDWKAFENVTPTVDVSYRKPTDNDADIKISGGIETWFDYNTWAIRAGGNDREITFGFSYNKMFNKSGLQLDYAFLFPIQLTDTSGSHRLALTFKYSTLRKNVESKEQKEQVFKIEEDFSEPQQISQQGKTDSYIIGKIVSEENKPVENVDVRISQNNKEITRTYTDENGEYMSKLLKPGNYFIKIWKYGYKEEKEIEIPLKENQYEKVDFQVKEIKNYITGKISTRKGKPIFGTVIVVKNDSNNQEIYRIYTNKSDEYKTDFLKPGVYRIKVWKDGYKEKEIKVDVKGTQPIEINFKLKR